MENEALHTHNFKKTVVPPTCKENGYTLYTCDCGYAYKTDYRPMGPHNFEIAETTPATCVEAGREKLVCATCGEVQNRAIPATGHTYGDWTVQAYPTCTEAGKSVRKCACCGVTQQASVPPRGHKCVPGTERRVQGRVVDYFCSNCGQTIVGSPKIEVETQGNLGIALARLVLLGGALAAVLYLIFMIALNIQPNFSYSSILMVLSAPALMIAWNVVFAFKADELKRNKNYTGWMGVAMVLYAIRCCISMASTINLNMEYVKEGLLPITDVLIMLLNMLLGNLPLVAYILLGILFFCGAKKNWWALIIMIVCAGLHMAFGALSDINFVLTCDFNEFWEFLYVGFILTSDLANILTWLGLGLLIAPERQCKLQ